MTIALVLAAEAVLLATLGPMALRRAQWVERAPRVGIVAWQALSAAVVLAAGFAGLALVVSTSPVSQSLAGLLRACALVLQAQYATPGGGSLAALGLAVAALVFGRSLSCLVLGLGRAAVARRRQHEVLAVIGQAYVRPDVTLLEHAQPAVYCLAGRPHRIVLTTAADQLLDDDQLAAVLAHEWAHLQGRHHVLVGMSAALARAFPGFAVFAQARDEVTRLVELLADDAAAEASHRLTLAEAILGLADSPAGAGASAGTPAGALSAAETSVAQRVRRLIAGHRPFGRARASLGLAIAGTVLATPALVLAMPSWPAVTAADCCTVHPPTSMAVTAAACPGTDEHAFCHRVEG